MTRHHLINQVLPDLPPMQNRIVRYLMENGPQRGSAIYRECGCLSFNQQINKARRFHGVPVVSHPIPDSREYLYSIDIEEDEREREPDFEERVEQENMAREDRYIGACRRMDLW